MEMKKEHIETWTMEQPQEEGYYPITSINDPKYTCPYVGYWDGTSWHCSVIFNQEDILHKNSPQTDQKLLQILYHIATQTLFDPGGNHILTDGDNQ